ncbi:MAG: cache domain-containing protein [Elusimicrobiales bacterium]|nr:cache domain-containing protein [Elusimicrobiales bacterium]
MKKINISKETMFASFIIVFFLIPFLLIIFQFRSNAVYMRKLYASSYLEMRTHTAARLVSDMLVTNYNLSDISNAAEFRSKGKASIPALAAKMPAPFYEIVLLDEKGIETYRFSSGKKTDYSYEHSEGVKTAIQTGMSNGMVEYDRYMPPVLAEVEPVHDRSGKGKISFIAGRFSLASMCELVKRLGKNSYGNMGLLDSGGQVIADSLGVFSMARTGRAAPEEILKSLEYSRKSNMSSSVHSVKSEKAEYLISLANVDGTDWWFYEVLDTSFMPLSKDGLQFKHAVIFGILLIIISGIASTILAKSLFSNE